MQKYLCLNVRNGGKLSIYNEPIEYYAYAVSGYNKFLNQDNSVIIYNNFLKTPSAQTVYSYARRIYNIDRVVDTNINAQKTPVIIITDENKRLSLINIYKKWDGNEPFIVVDKDIDLGSSFSVLKTEAPLVAPTLIEIKEKLWREALTYLGVPSLEGKKERIITDEVSAKLGDVNAMLNSRLSVRQQAAEKINKMFNLDITVKVRGDTVEQIYNNSSVDV